VKEVPPACALLSAPEKTGVRLLQLKHAQVGLIVTFFLVPPSYLPFNFAQGSFLT